jgi:hypothetical protein
MTTPHRVVPTMRPGALGATYHPPGESLEREVVDGLRCRAEADRLPPASLPRVGDVVGWREHPHGPVVRAVVQAVESTEDPWAHERDAFEPHGPDNNVWRVVTNPARAPLYDALGRYVYTLVADPWPSLVLTVEPDVERNAAGQIIASKGARRHTITRESRRPGDAGWLPADQIGA